MKEAFQPAADVAITDILGSLLNSKHFNRALYLGQYLIPQSNSLASLSTHQFSME